MAMKITY